MVKTKRKPTKEKIEERVVDLLSDLMIIIQEAEQGKIKGLAHYIPFNNCKVEILGLLKSPILDPEKKHTYKKSYTALVNQARKIYLRSAEEQISQILNRNRDSYSRFPTQRNF